MDTYKRDVYTDEGTHPPLFPKMSRCGRLRLYDSRNDTHGLEGGANPFSGQTFTPTGSAGGAAEVLNLHLQGQILLSRALEMEN